MLVVFFLACLLQIASIGLLLLNFFSAINSDLHGAPYVPLDQKHLAEILAVAALRPDDILVDFGSGDGRVLSTALREFGIKQAIGYEISLWPYLVSRLKLRHETTKQLAVHRKDFLKADISSATVVFMYLFPALVQKAIAQQAPNLKANARVVCVDYQPQEYKVFGLNLVNEFRIGGHRVFLYKKC